VYRALSVLDPAPLAPDPVQQEILPATSHRAGGDLATITGAVGSPINPLAIK
jgi:hypothetical protein